MTLFTVSTGGSECSFEEAWSCEEASRNGWRSTERMCSVYRMCKEAVQSSWSSSEHKEAVRYMWRSWEEWLIEEARNIRMVKLFRLVEEAQITCRICEVWRSCADWLKKHRSLAEYVKYEEAELCRLVEEAQSMCITCRICEEDASRGWRSTEGEEAVRSGCVKSTEGVLLSIFMKTHNHFWAPS